jgi:hypothetical protein
VFRSEMVCEHDARRVVGSDQQIDDAGDGLTLEFVMGTNRMRRRCDSASRAASRSTWRSSASSGDSAPRIERSSQRTVHTQAFESCEVTIGRHPFASGFDRDRGKIRIRDQVSAGRVSDAKVSEDVPVARPRNDGDRIRLFAESRRECQRTGERRRLRKDPRMRYDSQKAAQYELAYAVGFVAVHERFEPTTACLV